MKVRSSQAAKRLARALGDAGISPNAISAASILAAAFGAAGFVAAAEGWLGWSAGWLGGAAMIQVRLICNLMDGMVAIEGGRKSVTGDLWNEIPDRIADPVLILGAAWAAGLPWIGVLAGWAALMTAYVRAMGATLTGFQDFCGPFAKQQRMALLTGGALVTAADPLWKGDGRIMAGVIVLIAAGTLVTLVRRIIRLARRLHPSTP